MVFKNVPDDTEELPPHVEYKIRQDIDTVQNPRWKRRRFLEIILWIDRLTSFVLTLINIGCTSCMQPVCSAVSLLVLSFFLL